MWRGGALQVKWIRVFWRQKARVIKVGSGWRTGSKISAVIRSLRYRLAPERWFTRVDYYKEYINDSLKSFLNIGQIFLMKRLKNIIIVLIIWSFLGGNLHQSRPKSIIFSLGQCYKTICKVILFCRWDFFTRTSTFPKFYTQIAG
jgi:hypothetical protein